MPRDHFVARTYLKHFADPSGVLHGYRKPDGFAFPASPRDVCAEWDDDLNPEFLPNDPALLGRLRKLFEPNWNRAVSGLQQGTPSDEERLILAGYMANLMNCTPTAKRIFVTMHNYQVKRYLSFAKKMKEKHGGLPDLPVEAIEMMERGEISFATHPDFVKAMATRNLLDIAWTMYHQDWDVIENDTDLPFLTSDNPVPVLALGLTDLLIRFLPVTPRLCLSVMYHRETEDLGESVSTKQPSLGTIRRVGTTRASHLELKFITL